MTRAKIHLIAPAGSCRPLLRALSLSSANELIAMIQGVVGDVAMVTGNPALLEADEDELHGGRSDDRERATDIQSAIADDRVRAIIALRGGAWLTRILPRIDFSVLDHRRHRIAMLGFSEITTLVNIVGAHSNGIGVYDMSPAFLTYGLKRYAMLSALGAQSTRLIGDDRASTATTGLNGEARPEAMEPPQLPLLHEGVPPDVWMKQRLPSEFRGFFVDVASMLCGRGTQRTIRATLVRGRLPNQINAAFVGGNLCLFTALLGTRFERCIDPTSRWIMLEDINDKPERIDRFLARLTLAGYFDRCEGLLLGDFHEGDRTHDAAVLALLDYHLPALRELPVLVSTDLGHIWPVSPLPIHRQTIIEPIGDRRFVIHWSPSTLDVLGFDRADVLV